MKKRAFTLIEVMVVLSILALVAILAYNFFGSTMKEAKIKQRITQIYDGLRVLSDASEIYYQKNGAWPRGAGFEGADLVDTRILKSLPFNGDGWVRTNADLGGPTVATDVAVFFWDDGPEMAELCAAFNEKYSATIGANVLEFGPETAIAGGLVTEARANAVWCGPQVSNDTVGETDFGMIVYPQ